MGEVVSMISPARLAEIRALVAALEQLADREILLGRSGRTYRNARQAIVDLLAEIDGLARQAESLRRTDDPYEERA